MDFQGQKLAHDLCREIQKSSGRARLQEIFTGRSGNANRLGHNREHVPYRWRIEGAQFLTPLILEQEKERLAQMPHTNDLLLTLEEDTRNFVRSAHEQIVAFNMLCVAPLMKHIPNSSQALDPYTEKWPLHPVTDAFDAMIKPLDEDTLSQIAERFQKHPAIEFLQSQPPLMQFLSTEQLEDAVRSMEKQWREAGPMKAGPGYDDFLFQAPVVSIQRQEMGFAAALVSLRASLCVLNQYIFQGILDDKPPILNDESVFSMKITFHSTGDGVDLQYQPNELTGLAPQKGEIFYLKAISGHGFNKDWLCEVAAVGLSFGQKTGMVEQSLLRVLDENLCPFKSYWQLAFELR